MKDVFKNVVIASLGMIIGLLILIFYVLTEIWDRL